MNEFLKVCLKVGGCITALAAVVGGTAFVAERVDEIKNINNKNQHKSYGIYERFIKRPLDCFLSCGAIIVLSPIFLTSSILVRVKLGSPVLFNQERVGKNEKIFNNYKFRSMTNERDEKGVLLSDEVRLTKFGKLIRSTSIDELPELINILKGDMSIVGPRPLPPVYLPYYKDEEKCRHNVRPGLTGLAQVNGRNSISWDSKFMYDTRYVKNITFLGDVKIILQTVFKVLKRSDIGQGEEHPGNLYDIRAYMIDNNSNTFNE